MDAKTSLEIYSVPAFHQITYLPAFLWRGCVIRDEGQPVTTGPSGRGAGVNAMPHHGGTPWYQKTMADGRSPA